MTARPERCAGFTLLEVLVALAIVTLALAALVRSGAQSGQVAGRLERQTLAHWVAMNRMTELQLGNNPVAPGEREGMITMAGIDWQWRQQITTTPDPEVLAVDLVVSRAGEPRLAQLHGYLARHGGGTAR